MDRLIFDDIEIKYDFDAMTKKAHIREGSDFYEDMELSLSKVQQEIKPKAVIKQCSIDLVQKGIVTIDGVQFENKLIAEKLQYLKTVFLYVITAGDTLGSIFDEDDDFLIYVFESNALNIAFEFVKKQLQEKYGFKEMGFFEPGTIPPDWSIDNNKKVFEMIGDVTQITGVTLKASNFMNPTNTLSGIMYAEAD